MPKSFLKTLSAHLAKLQSKPSEPSSETPTPLAAIPSPQAQAALTEGSSRPSGVIVGLACKRVWDEASVSMGNKRTMPDSQTLIQALSNAAQVKERKESKASGKRPME